MQRHMTILHIVKMEGGAELHTRKGWRGPSRPAGTNRRRKLVRQVALNMPTTKQGRLLERAWSTTRAWWTKKKRLYNERLAKLAEDRRAEIAAALAAAEEPNG